MSCPVDLSPWRLEWSEELSVFIPEIDAEHQHFIRLVNALNEAIIGRQACPLRVDQVVRRFLRYPDATTTKEVR